MLADQFSAIYYWCSLTLSEVSDREPSRESTPAPPPSSPALAIGLTVRSDSLLLIREMLPMYRLPQKLTEMLDDFDRNVWTPDAHRRIKSMYPNLALMKNDGLDHEDVTMGELLTKWERLAADDPTEN